MKNRTWIFLFAILLVGCLALFQLLTETKPASRAEIISDGVVVAVVDLAAEQQFSVTASNGGENVITVQDGKIAVTQADCPDGYCVRQGFCNSGAQIVCLPHRLVIRFLDAAQIDGAVG